MSVLVAISQDPILRFVANDGTALVGGMLTTQVGGLNFPTYGDSAGQFALPNPIILNSRGEISTAAGTSTPLFVSPNVAYTFILQDAQGNTIWTVPNVTTLPTNAVLALLTPNVIGGIINPITQWEIDGGVTPTNFLYTAEPFIDPRRYGVIGDGVNDDTAAMQQTLDLAYSIGGHIQVPSNFTILITGTGLTETFTGSLGSNSITLVGASPTGSQIVQDPSMTTGSILTFAGPTAANPGAGNITMRNIGFVGSGKTINGLLLQNIAYFEFDNVLSTGFTNGCALQSSLIGQFIGCKIFGNNLGVIARSSTGGIADNNLVQFIGGIYIENTSWGFDWGQGSNITWDGCDIEQNGPAVDGSTPGVATTGGIMLRASMTQGIGQAIASIKSCHIENNSGCGFQTEYAPSLFYSIRDTEILSSGSGNAIICGGCTFAKLDNVSGDSGSTFYYSALTAAGKGTTQQLSVDGITTVALLDAGVVYPFYGGYTTSAGSFSGFRAASYPSVLTGVLTSPTASIATRQLGKSVRLLMPTLVATSNSTTCTIAAVASTSSAGSTTTLVDTTQSWTANQWAGFLLWNISTSDGALIISNTPNTLTFSAMVTANGSANTYQISALPANLYPPSNVYVPIVNQNSNVSEGGYMQITTLGLLILERNFAAFGVTGNKGVLACEATYTCA